MDEVDAYLKATRKASQKIYYGPGRKTPAKEDGPRALVALVSEPQFAAPRLPTRAKRRRSVSREGVSSVISADVNTSDRVEVTKNSVSAPRGAFSRLLHTIRLQTPTVHRQHLPPESFVRATMDRYTNLRERIVSMRITVKERHGDRTGLVHGDLRELSKQLCKTQYCGRHCQIESTHFFDLPITQGIGAWFRYLETKGPLVPIFSALPGGRTTLPARTQTGQPNMSMLSLASDGDLNNLFNGVLTKVVRGAKEGRFETKPFPSAKRVFADDEEEDDSNGEETVEAAQNTSASAGPSPRELRNVAWLFIEPPAWVTVSSDPIWEQFDSDVSVFVQSLGTLKAKVGKEEVTCSGYGAWVYTVLAAVELPLDPASERLLEQLYQLVCKSISAIRRCDADAANTGEALCCLDTLLVILCRQYQLNNKDLVPL